MKLIFVRNPLAPDKREIKYIDEKATVAEHLEPIARLWPDTEFSVSINGHRLEKEEWATLIPGDGDDLVVHPILEGGLSNFLRTILTVAIGYYLGGLYTGPSAWVKAIVTAAGMYIGGRIANAILPPPKQDNASNTYGWNGPQPTSKPGTPVGKTYGTVRVSPVLLARFVTTTTTGQYLNLLYSGGEGPVDSIDNILVDGNPIGNYNANTQYWTCLGTNDQAPIPNFNDTVTDYTLGYELDTTGDWSTQTTVGTADQGLQITIEFPYGLAHIDSNGNLDSASVAVEAQYQLVGASAWTEWSLANGGTTTGASNTTMWNTFRLDNITSGQYNVRMRCAGKSGITVDDLTRVFWTTLSEIIYDDFAYPNRVLVGVSILATNQLSDSDPTVTWEQTRSTVYVWNPNTLAYQTERASNPFWACYDLIHQCKYLKNINTGEYEYYVDGNLPSRIDYNAFANCAAYADRQVNGDNRFNLNIYLSENLNFWDALSRLSITGRGLIIPKGTLYSCICDMPGDSVQLFTVGNITAKSFKGEFMSSKDRSTSIEVTFYNSQKDYSQDQAVFYGPDYESTALVTNPVAVTYYGLTDFTHAYAEAAYLSRCNQFLNRQENWEADIDSMACILGDIVDVQHDIPMWGLAGGRIVSATATTVVLDKEVTLLANQSYALEIRIYTDQLVIVNVEVLTATTTTNSITVVSPFATIPQQYDLYAIGLVGIQTKPFKITNIAKSGDQKVKITGVEYIEAVYDEDITAPIIQYSSYNNAPVDVTGLSVAQESYMASDGTLVSLLNVSWAVPQSTFIASYSVWYSNNNGSTWISWMPGLQASSTSITAVKTFVTYLVKVCTINDAGVVSLGVTSTPVYITGKILPPANVQCLGCQEANGGFSLSWAANTDLDLAGYNIYMGQNGAGIDACTLLAKLLKSTSLFVPISATGAYNFLVFAVDNSGNVSSVPATVNGTFTLPPDVTGFNVVGNADNLILSWDAIPQSFIRFELRQGSTWSLGQPLIVTQSTSFTLFSPIAGQQMFWIKALDQYGNYSVDATFYSTAIVAPTNRNVILTIDEVKNIWPGVKINTCLDGVNLRLAPGNYNVGEYIDQINLPQVYAARNWVKSDVQVVVDGGIDWGSANFAWTDTLATAPWGPSADSCGATVDNQIACFTGFPSSQVESFPLDNTVVGEVLSTPAAESSGVAYQPGRFRNGVLVSDATKLSWNVAIPSAFSLVFYVNVSLSFTFDAVFMTLVAPSGKLIVGYDLPSNTFYLQDGLGNINSITLPYAAVDYLTFGVVQTAAQRSFYGMSYLMQGSASSVQPFASVGAINALKLYPY